MAKFANSTPIPDPECPAEDIRALAIPHPKAKTIRLCISVPLDNLSTGNRAIYTTVIRKAGELENGPSLSLLPVRVAFWRTRQ